MPPPPYSGKGLGHFGLKRNTPQKAFTLAETLITLAIIGIIAALTIPNLMAKYEEHVTVAKVKEAHSLLKNALEVARMEKGNFDEYLAAEIAGGKLGSAATMEYLATGLKVAKDCGTSVTNCRPAYWSNCSGSSDAWRNRNDRCALLENGMLVCVNREHEPPDVWGYIARLHVDINGIKGPNRYSRDDFWWHITKDNQLVTYDYGNPNCNATDCGSRDSTVKWILLKGNMDYLRKPVSW